MTLGDKTPDANGRDNQVILLLDLVNKHLSEGLAPLVGLQADIHLVREYARRSLDELIHQGVIPSSSYRIEVGSYMNEVSVQVLVDDPYLFSLYAQRVEPPSSSTGTRLTPSAIHLSTLPRGTQGYFLFPEGSPEDYLPEANHG